MIPHRPPEGVPAQLLDPAERLALQDHGSEDQWARACRNAALTAITSPDAPLIREFGLSAASIRPPVGGLVRYETVDGSLVCRMPVNADLRERSLGDDRLGRAVLTELAKRQRGGA